MLPSAKNCRMTYAIEGTFRLAQEIEMQRDSDNLHTIPGNGFEFVQEPVQGVGMSLAESPLHPRFLGMPRTIRNHERVAFTLSLCNNSEFDISAIHFESNNPDWHVSWAFEENGVACESGENAHTHVFTCHELPHLQTKRVSPSWTLSRVR